jgi:hypothetical protein
VCGIRPVRVVRSSVGAGSVLVDSVVVVSATQEIGIVAIAATRMPGNAVEDFAASIKYRTSRWSLATSSVVSCLTFKDGPVSVDGGRCIPAACAQATASSPIRVVRCSNQGEVGA